jgi:hypothetical protein
LSERFSRAVPPLTVTFPFGRIAPPDLAASVIWPGTLAGPVAVQVTWTGPAGAIHAVCGVPETNMPNSCAVAGISIASCGVPLAAIGAGPPLMV